MENATYIKETVKEKQEMRLVCSTVVYVCSLYHWSNHVSEHGWGTTTERGGGEHRERRFAVDEDAAPVQTAC